MARLITYGDDSHIMPDDRLIGSDGATKATKNFTVQSLANYIGNVHTLGGTLVPGGFTQEETSIEPSTGNRIIKLTIRYYNNDGIEDSEDVTISVPKNEPSLRSGMGAPTTETPGLAGDFYLDQTNTVLYGPKAGDSIPYPTPGISLIGMEGPIGRGIASIAKSGDDTAVITYTDGLNPDTITLPRGIQGIQGVQGSFTISVFSTAQSAPSISENGGYNLSDDTFGIPMTWFANPPIVVEPNRLWQGIAIVDPKLAVNGVVPLTWLDPFLAGLQGEQGIAGLSAYEIYQQETIRLGQAPLDLDDWLASLQGADGAQGAQGISRVELYSPTDPSGVKPTNVSINTADFTFVGSSFGSTYQTAFANNGYLSFALINPALFDAESTTYLIPETAWSDPFLINNQGAPGPAGQKGADGEDGDMGLAGLPGATWFTQPNQGIPTGTDLASAVGDVWLITDESNANLGTTYVATTVTPTSTTWSRTSNIRGAAGMDGMGDVWFANANQIAPVANTNLATQNGDLWLVTMAGVGEGDIYVASNVTGDPISTTTWTLTGNIKGASGEVYDFTNQDAGLTTGNVRFKTTAVPGGNDTVIADVNLGHLSPYPRPIYGGTNPNDLPTLTQVVASIPTTFDISSPATTGTASSSVSSMVNIGVAHNTQRASFIWNDDGSQSVQYAVFAIPTSLLGGQAKPIVSVGGGGFNISDDSLIALGVIGDYSGFYFDISETGTVSINV